MILLLFHIIPMFIMSCKLLFSCGVTESLMSLLRQRKRRKLVPILPSQPANIQTPTEALNYYINFRAKGTLDALLAHIYNLQ